MGSSSLWWLNQETHSRVASSTDSLFFHGARRWINSALYPDGHPKLLHLWPVKLLQAGRSDYDYVGVMAMREAASFRR